ncbi:hypothetical protein RSAG8_12793, partial [Rhizoctonia solani AG-8 WAC10335]
MDYPNYAYTRTYVNKRPRQMVLVWRPRIYRPLIPPEEPSFTILRSFDHHNISSILQTPDPSSTEHLAIVSLRVEPPQHPPTHG